MVSRSDRYVIEATVQIVLSRGVRRINARFTSDCTYNFGNKISLIFINLLFATKIDWRHNAPYWSLLVPFLLFASFISSFVLFFTPLFYFLLSFSFRCFLYLFRLFFVSSSFVAFLFPQCAFCHSCTPSTTYFFPFKSILCNSHVCTWNEWPLPVALLSETVGSNHSLSSSNAIRRQIFCKVMFNPIQSNPSFGMFKTLIESAVCAPISKIC